MPNRRGRPNKVFETYTVAVNGTLYSFKVDSLEPMGVYLREVDYYEAREAVVKHAARTAVHD